MCVSVYNRASFRCAPPRLPGEPPWRPLPQRILSSPNCFKFYSKWQWHKTDSRLTVHRVTAYHTPSVKDFCVPKSPLPNGKFLFPQGRAELKIKVLLMISKVSEMKHCSSDTLINTSDKCPLLHGHCSSGTLINTSDQCPFLQNFVTQNKWRYFNSRKWKPELHFRFQGPTFFASNVPFLFQPRCHSWTQPILQVADTFSWPQENCQPFLCAFPL